MPNIFRRNRIRNATDSRALNASDAFDAEGDFARAFAIPPDDIRLTRRELAALILNAQRNLRLAEDVLIKSPTHPEIDSRELIGEGKGPETGLAITMLEGKVAHALDCDPKVFNNLGCAYAWLYNFKDASSRLNKALECAADEHDSVSADYITRNLSLVDSAERLFKAKQEVPE
jgi:Flp pilus assembly protein TadD